MFRAKGIEPMKIQGGGGARARPLYLPVPLNPKPFSLVVFGLSAFGVDWSLTRALHRLNPKPLLPGATAEKFRAQSLGV